MSVLAAAEMSLGAAVALFLSLVAVGYCALAWLESIEKGRNQGADMKAGQAFDERRRRPALAALAARLGHRLPASYEALYADQDLVRGDDWVIEVPNRATGDEDCYLTWFEPADLETLSSVPSSCEGLLPFADNGLGDLYLIDPRQPDPDVIYFSHENDATFAIGTRLADFLAAPRHGVPDETGLGSAG